MQSLPEPLAASCGSLEQCRTGRVSSVLGGGRQQRAHFIPYPGPWLHSLLRYPPWMKWETGPSPSWEEWSQRGVSD